MKKISVILIMLCMLSVFVGGCSSKQDNSLTVFNYSMYIDPDLLEKFTAETGIEVKYEEATTPEELYTKYTSGAISYDLLCTSDYMLKRLIEEGQAKEIDYKSIPNYVNIDPKFNTLSEGFDPDVKYTVP